jgi:hypothetical protein
MWGILLAEQANFRHSGAMEPASFLDVFIAVIAANGVTVWIGYTLWRMGRNEKDTRAVLTFLALLGVIGAALLASS